MKKLLSSLALLVVLAGCAAKPTLIYVAPVGRDEALGTATQPVASLARARELARQRSQMAAGPVTVEIQGGIYRLASPWVLTEADSGTAKAPIIYQAAPGETPIFTGAELLTGLQWQPAGHGVWQTEVPAGTTADQLRLNGVEQIMARYPNAQPGQYMDGTTSLKEINQRAKNWQYPFAGAYVHGAHQYNWGSAHYRVTSADANGNLALEGGWQVNQQPGIDPNRVFIEGVRDELDAPGEWYLDVANHTLLVIPPAGMDLAKAQVEIIRTPSLVRVIGTPEKPVHDLVLRGLHFTGAARTFMETKEPLLRGDICIARQGALFIQNAEQIAVEGCTFENLGGNALFISEHARGVTVRANAFAHLGANAVCVVGDPSAVREASFWNHWISDPKDLTPGPKNDAYPADCVIEDNLMHELGELEKQTLAVLLSMSEHITVSHNSIYLLPRAGICINDGTWAGHLITGNDVFATVRETSDHGPLNAWGRDRHWIGSGVDGPHVRDYARLDSRTPTVITHNRFAHNPGTHSWGIDLDDGSSNYEVTSNLCLGCAIKLREGIGRIVRNNICVSPEAPGKHCCYENNGDVIRGNIFVNISSPKAQEMIFARPEWAKEIDYNLYFNTVGQVPVIIQISCKQPGMNAQMSLAEWQAHGFDTHSRFADPLFVNPASDDFRVREDSPALKLGFKNFAMDDFGTRDPKLKAQATKDRLAYDQTHAEIVQALTVGRKPAVQSTRGDRQIEWLGATVKNLAGMPELSATGLSEEKGVLVLEVATNSSAGKLGLKPGDVLLQVNGRKTEGLGDIEKLAAPAIRELSIWRAQKPVDLHEPRGGESDAGHPFPMLHV